MQRFWDRRARENAYFFVDDRVDYRNPDVQRFWEQGEEDLDRLLELLELEVQPTDTVVEIGCGVGRLTRVLSRRAARVIALDVSSEMLNRARVNLEGYDNVELIQGDGMSLAGIGDGLGDACVSHVVFQHVPEPEIVYGYISEMGRVLREGGWAGFQVSDDPAVHIPHRPGLRDRVDAVLRRRPQGRDDPAWLGTSVDLGKLERVATSAGLRVERVHGRGSQFCLVALRRAAAI